MRLRLVESLMLVTAVQALNIPIENLLDRFRHLGQNDESLLLKEARLRYAELEHSFHPEVIKAWDILAKENPERLEAELKKYEAKMHIGPQNYNNKLIKNPSVENYEVVESEKYADHQLRISKSDPKVLGVDTVKQHSGYLDVLSEDKHFFYWFFESRNDPENDPIILWLNGGPGCSSMTGLFFELGPSAIGIDLKPVYNPYSWNSNASIIFLDQPVGVGYSYSSSEIKSTAGAAKDFFVFLELFFQKYPSFIKNKFHIAGESYAGHYIPNFASEIINHADRSFELASVLIGNGITDSLIQYKYYEPMACGKGGYPQVISDEECDAMDRAYPTCAALVELCYRSPNPFTCVPATAYCEPKFMDAYSKTGLNVYDIRVQCADQGGNCYPEQDWMDDYLNLEYVKEALGVSNIDIYTGCDETVFRNFLYTGDETKPFQQYVAELLEKNIPVLLYAGDKDYICNWLGNHAWSDELEYSGHEGFKSAEMKEWVTLDGESAGEAKNYGNFTFLRVYDAGHMVPYNQPANSLDMVNRWVQGDYSFGN